MHDDQRGIIFGNSAATLMLHNADMRTGVHGLQLTGGTLCIHEECTMAADNGTKEYGITLGTGRLKDTMRLVMATPQSRLRVIAPHFTEKPFFVHKVWRALGALALGSVGIALGVVTVPQS